jgi:hypothetical protein
MLFADDLKIFHIIRIAEGSEWLQSDMYSVQMWCNEYYTKINKFKPNIIYFERKTNSIRSNYIFWWRSICHLE